MPYQYPYTSNSFLNLDYFIDQLAQVKQAVEPLLVSLNPTMTPNQFLATATMKTIYDAYLAGRPIVFEFFYSATFTAYSKNFAIGYENSVDKYVISGSAIVGGISGGAIASANELIFLTDLTDPDSYGIFYVDTASLI